MFPLKLGSELQSLVKKSNSLNEDIYKIQTEFPPSGMHKASKFWSFCDSVIIECPQCFFQELG